MLNDEEKNVIESLKNIAIYMGDNYTFSQQGIRNLRENLRIVLPAIEKQSKEIEELKDRNKELNEALDEWINGERTSIFHIHKDKIKAKIEEWKKKYDKLRDCEVFQKAMYTFGIELLQSLLEKEQKNEM